MRGLVGGVSLFRLAGVSAPLAVWCLTSLPAWGQPPRPGDKFVHPERCAVRPASDTRRRQCGLV